MVSIIFGIFLHPFDICNKREILAFPLCSKTSDLVKQGFAILVEIVHCCVRVTIKIRFLFFLTITSPSKISQHVAMRQRCLLQMMEPAADALDQPYLFNFPNLSLSLSFGLAMLTHQYNCPRRFIIAFQQIMSTRKTIFLRLVE